MKQKLLSAGAAALVLLAVLGLRGQGDQRTPHGELRIDCGDCHTSERWTPLARPTKFRHESTGFALQGVHRNASCRGCHRSLVFNRVGMACADCHVEVHRGELGPRCESCHTATTWSDQQRLSRAHYGTRFPLFGTHARLDCAACHRNQPPQEYVNTPAECGNCHLDTFARTASPNHVASGFSRRCEDCHAVTAVRWQDARFSHPESFPLAAGHGGLACKRCHTGRGYLGQNPACIACHQTQFAAAGEPSHAGFPTTCQECHLVAGWRPAKFEHTATGFPLTGAHTRATCTGCHAGGRYAGTPGDCNTCHDPDYARTTSPNHRAAGIPTDCQRCHSTTAWRPANFDHDRTPFPLTGAHTRLDCTRCHKGGGYGGVPTDCNSCHNADYARSTNPNHQASSFPTQCQSCHNTSAWRPATFNHGSTRFPLTGAHTRVDCARCHVGGRYTGTPTDCNSCHNADYTRTTNPNHQASSFPTQCQSCHNTSAWRPATFDHDGRYFPIYSGKHRGRWSSCGDCHVNAGNYQVFECILCHEHSNRTAVDSHHRSVSGYAYQSAACYRCHSRGSAGFRGVPRRLR